MSIVTELMAGVDNSQKTKIVRLSVDDITPNDMNIHYSMNDIDSLAQNIEEVGLLTPLIVYQNLLGEYVLISGHRRLAAIKTLIASGSNQFDEIPCKLISVKDTDQELEVLISANSQRQYDLQEKQQIVRWVADIYDQLDPKPKGRKRDWIAVKTGFSARSVQDYLAPDSENDPLILEAESENLEKKPQDKKFDIVKEIKKLKKSVDKFVEGAYENDCYSNTIAKLESDIYEIEKEFVLKTTHERSEK